MKKILYFLVCLSLVAVFAACGPAPTPAPTEAPMEEPTEAPMEEPTEAPTEEPTAVPTEEPIVIAGIIQHTVDPFWASLSCGAQAEAEKLGVELQLFTSTSFDANELTSLFDSALLAEPDGLFLNVQKLQQFTTQLQGLMAEGVPVASNMTTDPLSVNSMVWTSGDNSGFIESLLKLVPDDEGSVGVLGGVAGLVPLESRYLPVVAGIKSAKPNLTVLPTEYSFFDVNNATNIVSSWIVAHPDLKVIVASSGPEGIAAASAVKAAGLAGEITIIAFDAVPPEVEALKEGTITALIAQPAFDIGAVQVRSLVEYLRSGQAGPVPVATAFVGLPQMLLTAENVDDPANSGYIYVTECP